MMGFWLFLPLQKETMQTNRLLTALIVIPSLSAILYSCAGSKEETSAKMDSTIVAAPDSILAENEVNSALNELPKPSALPGLLLAAGVDYQDKIANSPNSAEKYTASTDKAALNLGVYATDLGYLATFKKTKDALAIAKATEKLGASLGLDATFQKAIKDRLEKNLENPDSLKVISDEGMVLAHQFLHQKDRATMAALMGTGLFVEGLYVSTSLVNGYPKNIPAEVRNSVLVNIIKTIIDQKLALEVLISGVEKIKKDPLTDKVLVDLNDLKKTYDELKLDEKIKENTGSLVINDQTIKPIYDKVAKLRADIVK